jgi:hypothetical protein
MRFMFLDVSPFADLVSLILIYVFWCDEGVVQAC